MRFMLVIIVLAASISLSANAKAGRLAPLNPAYEEYLATPALQRAAIYGCYIPEHNVVTIDYRDMPGINRILPEVYDLRQMNALTPIRDQGYTSACWCFSSIGALESQMMITGMGEYDLSENNMYYGHGYIGLHTGGNRYMSSTYLMRGAGPVPESLDPFQFDQGQYHPDITPVAYVPGAVWMPQGLSTEVIKQTIIDYGALDAAMNFSDGFFDNSNNSYYYPGYAGASINHLVNIVGWDDNYSTAGGRGAWIVRNCWGTEWGEAGYFYVSYNDYFIARFPAYWPKIEPYNSQTRILQYDDVGYIGDWGFGSNTAHAMIKYDIPAGYMLNRIGSYTTFQPSSVSYGIYSSFDGVSPSGLLTQTSSDTHPYYGFYVKELSNPLYFPTATSVYVLARFVTPGYGYPLAVEYAQAGTASPNISSRVAWISQYGTDGTWTAVGANTNSPIDLCTKLYISPASAVTDELQAPQLFSTFPNPAKERLTISLNLKSSSPVEISIYNQKGQLVYNKAYSSIASGTQLLDIPVSDSLGKRLGNGIYLCRISSAEGKQTKKITILH